MHFSSSPFLTTGMGSKLHTWTRVGCGFSSHFYKNTQLSGDVDHVVKVQEACLSEPEASPGHLEHLYIHLHTTYGTPVQVNSPNAR